MAQFSQLVHIGLFAVHRGMVEFEIAGVDDGADGGTQINTAGIRNGMADMEESEFK